MNKQIRSPKRSPEYDLGQRLKFLRESRRFTQQDLARIAGLSQASIAHIETGSKTPSIETLKLLADALDTHIATLFATEDVFVFDMRRLRRKYDDVEKLTPHLYTALGKVLQFAKDIRFVK